MKNNDVQRAKCYRLDAVLNQEEEGKAYWRQVKQEGILEAIQ
jgi:hypothetical protein